MMCSHEVSDPTTEVHDPDHEEKYCDHQCATMWASPGGKYWVIHLQIFGLEHGESTHNHNEKEREDTGFRHSGDHIWDSFGESFLEHFESREEDDEESDPLDRWIALEELGNIVRCDYHENDRDDESDHEIDDIAMACSCNPEHIVEAHCHISDDDHLDSRSEVRRISCNIFCMMLTGTNLAIELPDDIEQEYRSEEFESRNLEEKYDSEWEYDTKDRRTSHSPEDCFLTYCWGEFLGCHTDEDGIISTHDEVDEDDIEQCECSGCCEEMGEVWFDEREEFSHIEVLKNGKVEKDTVGISWSCSRIFFRRNFENIL